MIPGPRIIASLTVLSIFLFAQAPSEAADKAKENKKAVKLVLGYLNNPAISCKWAGHCRDDLKPVEGEYMDYLDKGEAEIKSAFESGATEDEVQKKIFDYRSGLQARETLYGRCPGKCLSYDFPVDFRNAARLEARKARVDLLIDISSIYYGAKYLLQGQDLSDKVLSELKQSAR